MNYFQTPDGYIRVSNKCPQGFKGVLFIGHGGPIGNIAETCYEKNQLAKFKKVSREQVPAEWLIAFGEKPPAPKPEPKVVEVPLLDDEGENLLAYIPVTVREPEPVAHDNTFAWGMLIAAVGGILWSIAQF